MINTGIVRKIDNLGRLVLPKELRYSLNIEPCTDFEILIDNEDIILRKYSKVKNNEETILKILNSFNINLNINVNVIVNKQVLGSNIIISNDINALVLERRIIRNSSCLFKIENNTKYQNNVLFPIVKNGDLLGDILIFSNEDIAYTEGICKVINDLIISKIVE